MKVKYLLRGEPTGSLNRLDVKYKSKRKSRKTKVYALSNWENGNVINWEEEDCKRSKFWFWFWECFSSGREFLEV